MLLVGEIILVVRLVIASSKSADAVIMSDYAVTRSGHAGSRLVDTAERSVSLMTLCIA